MEVSPVKKWFISYKNGSNAMGIWEDTTITGFELSHEEKII